MTAIYWRNFKTTEGGIKKVGTEQSGYQFKKIPSNTRYPVKHCTIRPAGRKEREIDRSQYAQGVEENNKRYQENNYTRHDKDKRIFFGLL
jgi:hypothetical protein